jgi:hypothetical protein
MTTALTDRMVARYMHEAEQRQAEHPHLPVRCDEVHAGGPCRIEHSEQMAYSLEEPEPQAETGMWPVSTSWRWVIGQAGRIMLGTAMIIMAIVAGNLVVPYPHQATVPSSAPTSILVGPPPPPPVDVSGPPFNAVTPDAQREILPLPPTYQAPSPPPVVSLPPGYRDGD